MSRDPNAARGPEPLQVAVAVVMNTAGEVLLTFRAKGVHQGELWEFPGGKLEPGENVVEALRRELLEELAIEVFASEPLLQVEHDYGDKRVLLDVHTVTAFAGEPRACEGQPMRWVTPRELPHFDFPAANAPIVAHLLENLLEKYTPPID